MWLKKYKIKIAVLECKPVLPFDFIDVKPWCTVTTQVLSSYNISGNVSSGFNKIAVFNLILIKTCCAYERESSNSGMLSQHRGNTRETAAGVSEGS